jgi:hypothetical protein
MSGDANETVLRILSRLPMATPDASRSERVRARCHTVLARRQRRAMGAGNRARLVPRALELAIVGGFCVCYVSAVILEALWARGIL